MGQQELIYSFVARGTTILAEYTEFKGNSKAVTVEEKKGGRSTCSTTSENCNFPTTENGTLQLVGTSSSSSPTGVLPARTSVVPSSPSSELDLSTAPPVRRSSASSLSSSD